VPHRTLGWLAALIAVLAVVVAAAVLVTDDGPAPPASTVTTKVDTLDGSPDKDKTLVVPRVAVDQAADALSGDVSASLPLDAADADHTGQRDETLPGAADAQLDANAGAQAENRATTEALPTAGASGGVPGCVTAFVRNQSGRRGVRPTVQVLHYTVSPNRPGRSDVNGITAYFNGSGSQASSHFVIDAEGNCNYIVPIEAKAWTQGGGNPWAVSYEIIATGRESAYLGAPGYRKLRSVMRWVSRRTGIPMRRGKISGCSPSQSGNVQHADGGTCWGGHHDIGPFSLAAVLRQVQGSDCSGKCARARSLRARHSATHAELRRRSCAPADRTRAERCRFLHRRHTALHAAAKREGVKL